MEEIYFPKYFNDWLNLLNNEQREKFWFLNDVAIIKSQTRMEDLMERFNLRSSFVPQKGKPYKGSANDELVKASEELTHTDLSPYWSKIHAELLYIQDKIKKAKTENQDFFYIDHEEKMDLFFWEIVNQDGLIFDYLNQEFDYENTDESKFDGKSLRDFDKIVDFIGRFRWLVELLNIVEDESYTSISESPARRQSKPQSWKELFRNPDHAKKVKEIFEHKGYTLNGSWQGHTDSKSELLCAYYVLKPLLKPGKETTRATTFYSEFGLKVRTEHGEGYISARALRKEPKNFELITEFNNIFFPLLNPT